MVSRVQKLNQIELRRMNETWKRRMESVRIDAERKLDTARDDFERDRVEVIEKSRRKVASEKEKCRVALEASEMRIQNKFSNEMRSQESSFKFRIQNLEEREKSRLDEERTKHELRRDEELKLRDEERANASRLDAQRMLREEISNLNREHEREMRKMIVVQQRQRKEIEEQRVAADVRGVRALVFEREAREF